MLVSFPEPDTEEFSTRGFSTRNFGSGSPAAEARAQVFGDDAHLLRRHTEHLRHDHAVVHDRLGGLVQRELLVGLEHQQRGEAVGQPEVLRERDHQPVELLAPDVEQPLKVRRMAPHPRPTTSTSFRPIPS